MRLALVLVCLSILPQAVLAQVNNAGTTPPLPGQQAPGSQPQDIELSCSDVALRLLLTNPEGIKFTPPPGPIGNSINKVVVFYPEAGAHNEQVVDEIISLLKQAKDGSYLPPAQRQIQAANQQLQNTMQPGNFSMGNQTPPQQPNNIPQFQYPIQNPNASSANMATANPVGIPPASDSRFNSASQLFPAQGNPDANRFPAPNLLERRPTDQFPANAPQSLNYPRSFQSPSLNNQTVGSPMVGIQRPLANPTGFQDSGNLQTTGLPAGQTSGNLMVDQLINQVQALNEQMQYQNSKMSQIQLDNYNLRNERVASQLATRDEIIGTTGTTLNGLPDPNDASQPGNRTTNNLQRPTSLGQPAIIPGPELAQRTDDARFMLLWLFLVGSIGLNIYLGMIARGLYVRYADLADELRETFSTGG